MMNIKNKKGFAVTGMLVLLVVAVLLVLAFIISSQIRWILAGLGLFVGGIYLIASLKSDRLKLAFALILLIPAIVLVFGSSLLQTQFGENDFVKPLWGKLICTDAYSPITAKQVSVTKSGTWIDCGASELVDQCSIYIDTNSLGSGDYLVQHQEYNIGGSGSSKITTRVTGKTGESLIKTIPAGKTLYVYVESSTLRINQNANFLKRFKLYKLYDDYGGQDIVNSGSCQLPSSEKINLLSGDTTGKVLGSNCLTEVKKGDWCNYVHDWVYGPGTNVFTHPQYGQVYCTGNKIYNIVKVTTASGKILPVNPTYQSSKSDGSVLNGLGNYINNVECCPNTPTCGNDFKFIKNVEDKECNFDIDCIGGGSYVYYGPKQAYNFKCINNKCTAQSPINVECSTDSDCASGYACNKVGVVTDWKCIKTEGEDFFGDDKGTCKWYQEPYTSIEKDYGVLYWRAIVPGFDAKETPISGCKTAGWVYWTIGGIVIIILGTIIFILLKPTKSRSQKGVRR